MGSLGNLWASSSHLGPAVLPLLLLLLLLSQLPELLAAVTSDGTQRALSQLSRPSQVLAHQQGRSQRVFP
jgi:hypothetical protein